MTKRGKCPYCKEQLDDVRVEDIHIKVSINQAMFGLSYICPQCDSILSVQVNPLALNEDLKNSLKG